MKIAVVSANYREFDTYKPPVDQTVEHDTFLFTERNFPLRHNALTPRMQARLVKCFAWQMVPDYDYYLWHDSSVQLGNDAIRWFLKHMNNSDMALMKHPHRNTVKEEAEYLKTRVDNKDPYLTPRYENELIDEQMEVVDPDLELYATTVFMYKPTHDVKNILKEWWYHISRYHSIDQLSLPHCLKQQIQCTYTVIPDSIYDTPYLIHTRNG